ncbi:MAG TPA: FadR family transcriptional regulator [Firmicutes bacterium]|nr:FadR family transcriptional regulator [Bacillota bacterium]
MYSQIHSSTLCEAVVNQIHELILKGELKPGDRLPPERELAERLGVSRTVIREASRVLTENGLLMVKPGKGRFITAPNFRPLTQSVGFLMRAQNVTFKHLLTVRRLLEVGMAGLAAQHATMEDIQAIRDAYEKMESARDDTVAFVNADQSFHLAVAKATKNPLFMMLLDPIIDLIQEGRRMTHSVPGSIEASQRWHKMIYEAIARRDKQGAEQAMQGHLDEVESELGWIELNLRQLGPEALSTRTAI